MNIPLPEDPKTPMHEALRRDAARVPEPPFAAALHHATMRRIRSLEKGSPQRTVWLWPALAAMALLALVLGLTVPRSNPLAPASPRQAVAAHLTTPSPRASVAKYMAAAGEGEAVLFTMLDRDAAILLPSSPSAFSSPTP